ncbi:MAG: hypothetical protein Q9170_005311 [Blastenia crenularia]
MDWLNRLKFARYYESWAATRKCQSVTPEDLNLSGYSHVNFAFAFFDPSSFQIAPMDSNSAGLYSRFTALKNKYGGLQTWISVGGWSFTDPGPTQQAFSTMTSSSGNRQTFINGIDLDWEYPQADDRGGQQVDTQNYVSLAKELKAALGGKGLSITLPTSYWYLQHFDVKSLQDSVDWFNFMTYDLHGVWDAQSRFLGPNLAPHTNLTEIDLGLDLLWRAGVQADKVVLGLGWVCHRLKNGVMLLELMDDLVWSILYLIIAIMQHSQRRLPILGRRKSWTLLRYFWYPRRSRDPRHHHKEQPDTHLGSQGWREVDHLGQ